MNIKGRVVETKGKTGKPTEVKIAFILDAEQATEMFQHSLTGVLLDFEIEEAVAPRQLSLSELTRTPPALTMTRVTFADHPYQREVFFTDDENGEEVSNERCAVEGCDQPGSLHYDYRDHPFRQKLRTNDTDEFPPDECVICDLGEVFHLAAMLHPYQGVTYINEQGGLGEKCALCGQREGLHRPPGSEDDFRSVEIVGEAAEAASATEMGIQESGETVDGDTLPPVGEVVDEADQPSGRRGRRGRGGEAIPETEASAESSEDAGA